MLLPFKMVQCSIVDFGPGMKGTRSGSIGRRIRTPAWLPENEDAHSYLLDKSRSVASHPSIQHLNTAMVAEWRRSAR